ncbi:aromatic-ring hydroxylase C-terminal domain-containing protein [Streptomyces mutabilis]|uniref:aromatic-ring hydroxylase C-terminal domain-containing protein n=1 Tax=Streptomyces mutabilis TaxID=67332 RepID=UPI0038B54421
MSPAPGTAANTDREHRTRFTTALVTAHDDHPDLRDAAEVLVRPDGHVAWVTRTTDP